MKYLLLLFLVPALGQAAQINLDCVDTNGDQVASIYTPTFVYSQLQLKVETSVDGEAITIDAPFQHSTDVHGLYIARTDELTAVGISESSPFAPKAKIQVDILKEGMSVLKLSCETTVNNPAFPRD